MPNISREVTKTKERNNKELDPDHPSFNGEFLAGPKKQQLIDRRLLPVRIRVLPSKLPAPFP